REHLFNSIDELPTILEVVDAADVVNDSFGYDMSWWKEEQFNASDVDANGLLNLAEFNE
ncbi:calcium-binding EF hand family protein, partial [Trifolium pratense]